MKKIILLFAILQMSYSFAQRPNGGRRGGGGQSTQSSEIPKFESAKIAGVLEYSSKKVLKKLKLKKSDSITENVTGYIEDYNKEVNRIERQNKDLFEGLDIVVNQNMETAIKNRNRELMMETRKLIEEKLSPIREEIKVQQDSLDTSLKAILTEDQNKKWLDYKKSKLEKLRPKRKGNDARNRPDNLNGRSGRRRG